MGILDSLTGGAWGNYFGNMADTGNPQRALLGNELQMRRFQQQLFMDQLRQQMQNNGGDLNRALYGLSPEGQREQYGYPAGQPIEPAPGVRIPTYIHGGQPIVGLPSAGIQGQPSQQPAAAQPQSQGPAPSPPGMAQMQPYVDWAQKMEAQKAAAVKAAEQTATAQPDLPVLQNRAQQVITKLQSIRDNSELPNVVGGPLGIKGRTGPLGQGQSDLLSDIQDANNALQGDLFTSMRAVSGRGISPGALKELRITDLNSRTGTVQGYKDNINKTIQQIKDEYSAGWEARGKPDAYKPNWAASVPASVVPTPAHINALKANPQRAAEFDNKFGAGAAMRVLGQ